MGIVIAISVFEDVLVEVAVRKMAPYDQLWGHLDCVRLTGFELATINIVGVMLYPLSYSGTQRER